jgi:uncharacterized membrane protein YebE (DUF533 family)
MGERDTSVLTAVQIWAATAWADGTIAKEEEQAMEAVIAAARLTEAERAQARRWLTEKVSLDEVDVSELSDDNRHNIYSAALGVVTVDADVADAERTFLGRLREALDIDEDTAAELEKEAGI